MNPTDAIRCRNRRRARILAEAMRLVQLCKVPPIPEHYDCGHGPPKSKHSSNEAAPANWTQQLAETLPQLVEWVERHQQVLFAEERETQEFRKMFTLVYFEQVSRSSETFSFQLDAPDLELQINWFDEEVDNILTRPCNNVIRQMLFHHYGMSLSLQNWQYRPGETYSFVRMVCFLVEYDRMELEVQFGPKAISFMLDLGKELLSYRASLKIQSLGVMLLNAVMRQVCKDGRRFENSKEILVLLLELTKKPIGDIEDALSELWNMIYYCARSISGRNVSLDDEIMRSLMGKLIDEEAEMDVSCTYVKTVIRMFLLDVPEVHMEGFEVFTISGRKATVKEVRKYIKNHFSSTPTPARRLSSRWRLRIGKVIPVLFSRYGTARSYQSQYFLEGLQVLFWVVIHPVGAHWRQQRAQGYMLISLLTGLGMALYEQLVEIRTEDHSDDDWERFDELEALNNVFMELFSNICDCTLQLMRKLQRETNSVRRMTHGLAVMLLLTYRTIAALGSRFEEWRSEI